MIRRAILMGLFAATSAGCGSGSKEESARLLTPAPPPPTAAPGPPNPGVNKSKVRPPTPPRLTAPK